MVQFATISRSQIYPGAFSKFTGTLSILERNILQCNFSFKMAASSCCQNVHRIDQYCYRGCMCKVHSSKLLFFLKLTSSQFRRVYSDITLHLFSRKISYGKIKRCTRIDNTASKPLLNDHIPNKHHGISDDTIKL